jgi:hypothetical protein
MLVDDSFTNSANGACGRHSRQDSTGISDVTMASGCQSSRRRSTDCVVQQPWHRTHRNQC